MLYPYYCSFSEHKTLQVSSLNKSNHLTFAPPAKLSLKLTTQWKA